jgi:hypothetical protein
VKFAQMSLFCPPQYVIVLLVPPDRNQRGGKQKQPPRRNTDLNIARIAEPLKQAFYRDFCGVPRWNVAGLDRSHFDYTPKSIRWQRQFPGRVFVRLASEARPRQRTFVANDLPKRRLRILRAWKLLHSAFDATVTLSLVDWREARRSEP